MTTMAAFRDGVRRVAAGPAVLLGVYSLTLLVALPMAMVLRGSLRGHLGSSMAAETAASGVNYDWWQEFTAQASGVATTFSPTVIGFGAVMDNLSALLDKRSPEFAVAAAAATYLALWGFLAGGILDRYARDRRLRAAAFFAACGVYFLRFIRLAVVAGIVYWFLFAFLHKWLFTDLYPWATRETSVERSAFALRLMLYLLFGSVLLTWNALVDYAKIRAVVEDRRSMLGAIVASARFAARRPAKVAGLYLLNGAVFVLLLAVYGLVAPGAGRAGLSMWLGFVTGQAYLIARLWIKLLFCASQTAFFQGELAHASYTAAPLPVWPDSPAAEAIANASVGGR